MLELRSRGVFVPEACAEGRRPRPKPPRGWERCAAMSKEGWETAAK